MNERMIEQMNELSDYNIKTQLFNNIQNTETGGNYLQREEQYIPGWWIISRTTQRPAGV